MRRNLRKLFLCVVVFFIGIFASAQSTISIGTGTASNATVRDNGPPLTRYYNYSASEQIYLGSEIGAVGNITSVGFYKAAGSNTTDIAAVTIYMKTTTATTVGTTATTSGYTQVYSGVLPNSTATGWMTVNLSTPFSFTSTSNNLSVLVVKGYQDYLSTTGELPRYYITTMATNMASRYFSDDFAFSNGTSMTQVTTRPNIQLVVTPTITATAASFGPWCSDVAHNVTLTYTTSGTFTGTYRIQASNASGTFPSNVTANLLTTVTSGTGTITAAVPAGVNPGTYRVRVINSAPAVASNDNGSNIVVSDLTTVAVTPSTAAFCVGTIQPLTVSAASTATSVLGSGASTSVAESTTSTIGPNPFQNYYGGSKQQMLVRASELTAMGMSANGSIISNIGIYLAGANTSLALQNVNVKMQNSSLTALTTTLVSSNWTSVYTNASLSVATGVNALALSTPFTWDGTSNLLIEINYSNANQPLSAVNTATYDGTSFVSTSLYRADNTSAAVMNGYSMTANYTYSSRNRLQFIYKNYVGSTWTPTAGLYTDAAATVAYTGANLVTVYAKPTATTTYTASSSSGGCTNTGTATLTVSPLSVGGTINASTSVCTGTNSGTLTLSGNTGNVIRWESSTDNFATAGTTIANTTTSLSYSGLTATTYYRAVVQSGSCATANSSVATITVNPASVGGSVSGSAAVCATSNSGTLTLSGNTGAVVRWESSTDNFATAGTTIANTTTSLSYSGLTATTYYRAVVQSGSCATANSSVATITVNPASVGGSVSGSAAVCATSNSGTLTLSGNTGNVIRWESSTDNFATAGTTIANTTTSLSYSGLTATTYYRAVVQSGSCATANSSVATIAVNAASVGGSVSGSATVCTASNSGTLTLSGNTGSVIRWESSTNNFATAGTTIANTTTSLSYSGLTVTTYYRAIVQSGSCATANSSVATITVNPASVGGSVSGSTTVCTTLNSGTLTLSGNTGNVIRWESSTDNFATAGTTIANTTTSLSYSGLTVTTYYRAIVQSGSCATANSSVATIAVNPASVGGSVSGSATVCVTLNSGSLTLSGNIGNVIRWESSTDNFATAATTIANTTTSLSYGGLTTTTYYRAVVQSGSCATANSSVATITVNPAPIGGSVSGSATVCATSNSGALTLSGNTGNVIRWESSTDNFATAGTTVANTTTSLSYSGLTVTTYYRAIVQSGSCATANSSVATIMVNPASVGGSVSGSATVCTTSNSGTLTLSGNTGNVIRWESSTDNFATAGTTIANTTTSLSYSGLTVTTYYRAVVQSGSCATATSAVATITIVQENVGGTLNGSSAFCSQTNSGTLTLSGYMGSQLSWQYSYDNFATAGIAITNTSATYNYANLSQTTYFRVVVGNGACASQVSTVAVITVDNNSTWTGAADSNWHNGANWSCGEVPQSYTHVTIPAVSPQPIISADAFAYNITASSGTLISLLGGHDLMVTDAINSAGGFTVENNANVIQINNVANTGIAKVKRNSSALMRQDYTLWSSPVSGQNLLAFSTQTLTNRFYTYNTGTNLYNTVAAPATTAFDNGVGYLIRMPNNHPTTPTVWNGEFNGTLHNGNVSVPLANIGAGQRFNAVGNPYPSAIDMQTFVSNNASNITGALYFWRKTNNPVSPSYCSWTPGGGFVNNGELQAYDPQGVIRTGQGFFVEASASGTQVAFNNAQRSGNNANQFFRSANEIERNRIWLNATNAAGSYCQTLVGYIEGATMGDDAQIDGKFFNDGDISFYSLIGAERFVIQGRPLPFDAADVVPMGFRATTAGTYSIAIDHLDGLFQNGQEVFVRDNLTGSVHDLGTGAYSFASDAGTFNTRFDVLYQSSLSTHNPVFNDNSVIVYKNDGVFTINSGNIDMASVKVYDVLGKLVKEVKDINAAQTSFTVGGANQVLIFKIYSTESQEVVKKVVN